MTKSALMISVGHPIRSEDQARAAELGLEAQALFARWKDNGMIEEARHYLRRSGNRMEQLGFVILEGNNSQIDTLLEDPALFDLEARYATTFYNTTVNRLGALS